MYYIYEETLSGIEQLTTERLLIRHPVIEDAADIFEIRGDWSTAADAGAYCMESIEDAKQHLTGGREDWLVIVLGNEVIGLIEAYFDEELYFDSLFLGYYMKKNQRGKGYMTEALTAVKNELFKIGYDDLILWIYPDNVASRRVAVKCGWNFVCCHIADIGGFNQYVDFYRQKK